MALVACSRSAPEVQRAAAVDENIHLFFKFVDKNLTLSVKPETQIETVKTLLVQKVALMQAAEKCSSATNNGAVSAVLGLFWMATLMFQKQQLRAKDIHFVWNGKPLDGECMLADYSMRSGAVVHVSGRLRGGCFMISASIFCILCAAVIGSPCTCGVSLVAVPFLLPLLFILPLFCL